MRGGRAVTQDTDKSRRRGRWAARGWYRYLHAWSIMLSSVLFHMRVLGRRNVPRRGGVIIAANHQSFLDPPLIGLGAPRQISYLAAAYLFDLWRGFTWLIRSLNAIPVKRTGGDRQAYREMVNRLRAGGAVLMFPEGTRTWDGSIGPLRPGVWNIARRAGAPIVPAVIDGAHEAWPRGTPCPRPHPVRVMFGPPISAERVRALTSDGLTDLLSERLNGLLDRCRATRSPEDNWYRRGRRIDPSSPPPSPSPRKGGGGSDDGRGG